MVKVAYYGEANGDLYPDPLIEFDQDWKPIGIEQWIGGWRRATPDVAVFSEEWARLIEARYLAPGRHVNVTVL